jgi:hypothetical protein
MTVIAHPLLVDSGLKRGAKAISGDDGDVIVPILTISQSASSMTH